MTEPNTQRWIVDRLDGDDAVVEIDGERFVRVPRWLLPNSARADEVFDVVRRADADGHLTVEVRLDPEATAAAQHHAKRLVDELRKKDPGGDVVL